MKVREGSIALEFQIARIPRESQFFRRPVDDDAQLLGFEGFGNKIIGALLHGLDCGLYRREAGNHDDQYRFVEFPDTRQYFHPVHPGHFQIQQDNGNDSFGQDIQSFGSPGCLQYLESGPAEDTFGPVAYILFIIDNQYLNGLISLRHFDLLRFLRLKWEARC